MVDSAYRTVADRAASNPDLRFETVDGKTRIVDTPLDRLEDTEGLRALRPAVQGRMPKAGMPDLFLEIMQRTGFAKAFTHLSERQARVEHFETSLCAALVQHFGTITCRERSAEVAEACNIGIEAVSRQDVPALRRERPAWVSQHFIRPETIAAARRDLVQPAVQPVQRPERHRRPRHPARAIYMHEAIGQVRADGMDVSNDDIAHVSPLIWGHLNFLGRYDFSLPDTVMNGGLFSLPVDQRDAVKQRNANRFLQFHVFYVFHV